MGRFLCITYSHSRLSTFEQCKYQYKLQYIDRIKVDIPTTIECFIGVLVHKTLEKLYKDLKFQKLNSSEELLHCISAFSHASISLNHQFPHKNPLATCHPYL